MSGRKEIVIALAGNPNSGKTSLFNLLTGSRSKVGNYPGVTVERLSGEMHLPHLGQAKLVDLPGAYSLFPTAADERVATEVLIDPNHPEHPDLVVYVADINQLDRQLLAFQQIRDLGLPILLVLSLMDEFDESGHEIDLKRLQNKLGAEIIMISSRKRTNISDLIHSIDRKLSEDREVERLPQVLHRDALAMLKDLGPIEGQTNLYRRWLWAHHHDWLPAAKVLSRDKWQSVTSSHNFQPLREQVDETFSRLDDLEGLIESVIRKKVLASKTEKWDRILTHWFWGPMIFVVIMLLVFQAIFAWATLPMDWIEGAFGYLSDWASSHLPATWFGELITEGVIPGVGGVMVFIPQIAILFFLISILEEIGYMSRAVYLFDRRLQKFGMNGRSVVALISGGACAIPAVMATRTIVDWKERLITIFVTPFISCSARIPVYTVLVAFVVPYESIGGIFNSQGLFFAGLYVLGVVAALAAGWVLKKVLKSSMHSFLMLELPDYRMPDWKNVWRNVSSKVGSFIKEAGKIILVISIILWFLASYGLPGQMKEAREIARVEAEAKELDDYETEDLMASRELEASFAGMLGRQIEPLIKPLGYDWKIGIGLLSAFAAREVFIGAMATIYSIGSEEDEFKIREHLAKQTDPVTNKPIFNYATALSLLLFFVFAMQCMSTLAVVKKETMSWKWPILQFTVMTGVAYLAALAAYQLN